MYHSCARVVQTLLLLFSTQKNLWQAQYRNEKNNYLHTGHNPQQEILEKKISSLEVEKNVKVLCLRNAAYFSQTAVYLLQQVSCFMSLQFMEIYLVVPIQSIGILDKDGRCRNMKNFSIVHETNQKSFTFESLLTKVDCIKGDLGEKLLRSKKIDEYTVLIKLVTVISAPLCHNDDL